MQFQEFFARKRRMPQSLWGVMKQDGCCKRLFSAIFFKFFAPSTLEMVVLFPRVSSHRISFYCGPGRNRFWGSGTRSLIIASYSVIYRPRRADVLLLRALFVSVSDFLFEFFFFAYFVWHSSVFFHIFRHWTGQKENDRSKLKCRKVNILQTENHLKRYSDLEWLLMLPLAAKRVCVINFSNNFVSLRIVVDALISVFVLKTSDIFCHILYAYGVHFFALCVLPASFWSR